MYTLRGGKLTKPSEEEFLFGLYAEQIQMQWQENLVGFLRVGNLLALAKAELPRLYLKLVREYCPFGPRMAQILVKVAQDPRLHPPNIDLNNPKHAKRVSLLPPAVGTLYELTKLDDVTFKQALARGDINPAMKRKEAKRLVNGLKSGEAHAKAAEQNIGKGVTLWLADPPWDTSFKLPYGTLSLQQIKDLRPGPGGEASTDPAVPSVTEASAPNAAIGVWAIDELLHDAEAVLDAWGFQMLSPRIIWDKGSHVRAGRAALMQHEYLLIGIRGAPVPVMNKPTSVVTVSHAGLANSEKPTCFHQILQDMFPMYKKRVELFARRTPPNGWRGWGNQNPGDGRALAATG
jgi:N6-adenosine-specific RNA methylase IME4